MNCLYFILACWGLTKAVLNLNDKFTFLGLSLYRTFIKAILHPHLFWPRDRTEKEVHTGVYWMEIVWSHSTGWQSRISVKFSSVLSQMLSKYIFPKLNKIFCSASNLCCERPEAMGFTFSANAFCHMNKKAFPFSPVCAQANKAMARLIWCFHAMYMSVLPKKNTSH